MGDDNRFGNHSTNINTLMTQKPKLLTTSTIAVFAFVFAMTTLDVVLSYLGWKPTFGDDLIAGIIGFLPSVGSVSLSMLIAITHSRQAKLFAGFIWLGCIVISLSGNFLNMTNRAFEMLDQENVAVTQVQNIDHANVAQLELFDVEINDLTIQYEDARESRDLEIHDGVNHDGSMGPKARAFQAAMDRITQQIEQKRTHKREIQAQAMEQRSQATVNVAQKQNDMDGHMPVIRYFLPDEHIQRQAILWGLGVFATIISLTGPLVSYSMALHLNHKKITRQDIKQSPRPPTQPAEAPQEPAAPDKHHRSKRRRVVTQTS